MRLASVAGLTPRTAARLVARFGSASSVLAATPGALAPVRGVGAPRAALVAGAPSEAEAREEIERVRRSRGDVLIPGDPGWPAALADLTDPPLVLLARGAVDARDGLAVAVVGSRRASAYGLAQARRLGAELSSAGFTVVSGLARGVDAAAHRGALAAGGRTLAVLGSGLARLYPPEHVRLAAEIADGSGAVLSEFPLDVPPLPHHFPRRNRLLAALSRAVVVVEAAERSGSLITADHALDLGREVLAVPGRVDSDNSAGTHRLLREGAALCGGVADVLRALGVEAGGESSDESATSGPRSNDATEAALLSALAGEERDADDLLAVTGLAPSSVLAALTELELAGRIRLSPDGRYART